LNEVLPTNHGFCKSIYFFDPNGQRMEMTAKTEKPGERDRFAQAAPAVLAEWEPHKKQDVVDRPSCDGLSPLDFTAIDLDQGVVPKRGAKTLLVGDVCSQTFGVVERTSRGSPMEGLRCPIHLNISLIWHWTSEINAVARKKPSEHNPPELSEMPTPSLNESRRSSAPKFGP
jgi:hypothetical protein